MEISELNFKENKDELDEMNMKITLNSVVMDDIDKTKEPIKKKRGRPLKYKTEEERKIGEKERSKKNRKRFYERHREEILTKIKIEAIPKRKSKIEKEMMKIEELEKTYIK